MLSMIIPGKKAPGNDIDVYMQPLIQELAELWRDGIQTYDSHEKTLFNLRAALMWTISDFPGLGTLSGWNTHTGKACPCCNFDTESVRLPHSRKWCFMGHRRFLDGKHKFRMQRNRFDGKTEKRGAPATLTGSDIFDQQQQIEFEFGKVDDTTQAVRRIRATSFSEPQQWRKRSIFFNLPYWKSNLLRHALDVMHIEKNVCDNVLYTMLNEPRKSKDHLQARRDLKAMGVRQEAWPDDNDKFQPARFTLTKQNKDLFLATLKKIKVLDGYSSNISRCVDLQGRKIAGLKSHDCHVLLQQLLPLAMRNTMPTDVSIVLVELCSFFRKLCSKVLVLEELEQLQAKIILTLCHLEMLFPPSFFTVMVHLTVHLVHETKLAGPVQYRWMYPMERFLGKLKSYVRNKTWPEGCIAEGYLGDEVLYFCSRYFDDIETSFNRPPRVNDVPDPDEQSLPTDLSIPQAGRPVGGSEIVKLTPTEKLQAHRYVLHNCSEVDYYIR